MQQMADHAAKSDCPEVLKILKCNGSARFGELKVGWGTHKAKVRVQQQVPVANR